MSDPVSGARSARENLAQGLAALQAPGVPPQLMNVAEPIAKAMSALHQIEASGGAAVAQHAPAALEAVRGALAQLQSADGVHPAVTQAMEAVASSLGVVHSLTQAPPAQPAFQPAAAPAAPAPQGLGSTVALDGPSTQPSAGGSTLELPPIDGAPAPGIPRPGPQASPQPYQPPAQQAPQYQQPPQHQQAPQQYQQPQPQPQYQQPPQQQAAPAPQYQQPAPQPQYQQAPYQPPPQQQAAPAPQPQYQQPPQQAQAPQQQAPQQQPAPQYQQPPQQAPAQPQYQQPPQQAPNPYGGAPAAYAQPAAQAPAQAPPPQAAPAQARPGAGPPAIGDVLRLEAALGANSQTNFYKGLSGNDVIDDGGIFIATYQIPDMGQPLVVKVSMPGGYEFEAKAIVRWTREAPNSGADAPPGFGAAFTEISPEGRQLVYRYVRNREPLFHDDF